MTNITPKSKQTENKVQRIINDIITTLIPYGPEKIILFGSRARGDFRINSDIDIAVDLRLSFREKRKLKEKLDNISGLYSVDIVFLPDVNKSFKNKILKEGKVLYEKK
ncbi:type VII toxin-antitoxin system MntA family adenylyltransferase antitoxin [Desulfurobacterium atlanticum]|uniref:Predicted nucleotidyltransferase n=1 Tax=Desulfurobacterium atlanticum TaxID=240169 RepID=A0A238XRQ1_9BACT|nr:nucleotidyltransferase domain-containing protein [Desulfurobacterium atlanticum]SNR61014.1 Predicted nucleotidyltransferase [Desulfurobacterium atlanticum]